MTYGSVTLTAPLEVAHDSAHEPGPAGGSSPGSDDPQVYKSLGLLLAMLDVWQARGQLVALDRYMTGRRWCSPSKPGRNPLGNLRPFAEFHAAITSAADALRYPNLSRGSESGSGRRSSSHVSAHAPAGERDSRPGHSAA